MSIFDKAVEAIREASPTILSCLAVVGVGLTVYSAVKAKPEADKAVEDIRKVKGEAVTTKDEVLAAGKCYGKTAVLGAGTVLCIFGANALNKKQQALLAAAYPLLEKSFDEYKDAVKEVFGIEGHNKVVDHIQKSKCDPPHLVAPCTFYSCTLDVQEMYEPEITRTFYDEVSQRYFEATLHDVDQAIYHLNRNYALGKNPTENEWFEFLGLEPTEKGNRYIWYMDANIENEVYWIDFEYQFAKLDDGMEVIYIKCLTDTVGIDELTDFDLVA